MFNFNVNVIVICQVTIYATRAMQYTIYTEWTTELPTCWLLNVEVTGVSQHNTQLISSQQPSHHRHNTPTDWTHSLSAHRELQCHCSGACRSTSLDQATSTHADGFWPSYAYYFITMDIGLNSDCRFNKLQFDFMGFYHFTCLFVFIKTPRLFVVEKCAEKELPPQLLANNKSLEFPI